MEHIAALLLIVGCSDDLAQCRELSPPTAVYEAVEDCEADLQPSIGLFTTKVPQVFGECVEVDPSIEQEDAELVWDIKADGTLLAMIEVPEIMIATALENREKDHISQD